MEPWGSEQYNNSDLYVYTKYGSVCCNDNDSSNGQCVNSTDVCGITGDLSRSDSANITNTIHQWYQWIMEPSNSEQYGNGYVYIYTNSRPMREHNNACSDDTGSIDCSNVS